MSSFFFVLRHTKQRIVHHDKHPVTGTAKFSFLLKRAKKSDIVTMKMVQQSVIKVRFYLKEYILCWGGGLEFEFLIKLSFIYSVYTVFLE